MTRRGDQIAVVQAAVDIEAAKKELRGLLKKADQNQYDADQARLRAGQLLLRIRGTIPVSGPKAGAWGELCRACGVSLDTAARYMRAAEYVAANPDALDGKSFGKVYQALGFGGSGWEQSYPQDSPQRAENLPPKQAAPALPVPVEQQPPTLPTKSAKPPTRTIYDRSPGGGDEGAQEEYGDGMEERQLDEGGERIPLFPSEPAAEALRGKPTAPPPKPAPVQPEFEWDIFRDEVATYVDLWKEECPSLLYPDLGDLLIAEGNRLKETRP